MFLPLVVNLDPAVHLVDNRIMDAALATALTECERLRQRLKAAESSAEIAWAKVAAGRVVNGVVLYAKSQKDLDAAIGDA